MEIYLQKPGLGNGPFMVFQIREFLSDGKLTTEDIIWHDGMPDWLPIKQAESLQHLLPPEMRADAPKLAPRPSVDATAAEPEREAEVQAAGDALPAKKAAAAESLEEMARLRSVVRLRHGVAWRRFWARLTDLSLFTVLVWCAGLQFGVLGYYELAVELAPFSLGMESSFLKAVVFILWVLAESLLLNTVGTTPGKALLGIRVVDENGNRPSMPMALKRSLGVCALGVAFGLALASVVTQMISHRRFVMDGTTAWDEWAGSSIQVRRPSVLGILTIFCIFVAGQLGRCAALVQVPPTHLPQERREEQELFRKFLGSPSSSSETPSTPAKSAGKRLSVDPII